MKTHLLILLAMLGCSLFAQNRQESTSTFSVELKPTAAEQYKYATTIVKHARETGKNPDDAVIEETAALEIIPQHWPNDRGYGVAAYREAVHLLTPKFPLNAIQIAERAEKYVGQDPDGALIQADKGTALMSVGRTAEAEQTFRQCVDGKAFNGLGAVRRRIVLKKAAFFYERQKHYREAATLLRRAAPLGAGALDAVMDYEKSLELDFNDGNVSDARVDLDALIRETAIVRTKRLSPEEMQQLPYADEYIETYKKKLK